MQPVVPVVTALLAGMLIGSVTDPSAAQSASPGATILLPGLPPVPAMTPVVVVPPAAPLPLLPAPTVAVATPAPAATTPPADTPPADPGVVEPDPVVTDPAPDPGDDVTDPAPVEKERATIKHIFIITLSDQGADAAYGPQSPATYLAKTLKSDGTFLPNHFAVTRGELANQMALLSGQGPTPDQQAGCPVYSNLTPADPGDDGQERGTGCLHTPAGGTIADQVTGLGKPWAAYVQSMGTPCRHPAVGAPDDAVNPRPEDPYSSDRNPLTYFHSTIDDTAGCAQRVKDLTTLPADLKQAAKKFPALTLVSPDRCHAGSDTPCLPDQPAGGLAAADAFLKEWVPQIEKSAAYKDGGLIVITTDQAPDPAAGTGTTGPDGTTGPTGTTDLTEPTSCCLRPTYPNVPPDQPGGGRVGLLFLSRDLATPGAQLATQTNHFDLLKGLEELLGLTPLGYAANAGVTGLPLDDIIGTK